MTDCPHKVLTSNRCASCGQLMTLPVFGGGTMKKVGNQEDLSDAVLGLEPSESLEDAIALSSFIDLLRNHTDPVRRRAADIIEDQRNKIARLRAKRP